MSKKYFIFCIIAYVLVATLVSFDTFLEGPLLRTEPPTINWPRGEDNPAVFVEILAVCFAALALSAVTFRKYKSATTPSRAYKYFKIAWLLGWYTVAAIFAIRVLLVLSLIVIVLMVVGEIFSKMFGGLQ